MVSVSTAWIWVSWPWASGSWHRLHGYGIGCMSIEDATHGISIDCMGISSMGIGNCHHRTRKRHQHHGHGYRLHGYLVHGIDCMGIWFMVSAAWVYGSGMIHGAINCNNYKSDTSRRCHTWYRYRLHRCMVPASWQWVSSTTRTGHHTRHGYRVPPEQNTTHGISIGCMGIWFMVSAA